MKKTLLILSCVVSMFVVTSCSAEEINQDIDVLGVWERTTISEKYVDTFTLVFGSGNTGLKITVREFNTGEKTSSAVPFNWVIKNEVVTLLEDEMPEIKYLINADGQLILTSLEGLGLIKISNDYSKYY